MVDPIQRSDMHRGAQAEAGGPWTEPVKRPGGTAPLAGADPKEHLPPTDRAGPDVLRHLSLRFRIDPDTQDITVLIVDPATRRVVRSVPPEELQKMSEGELVELRI